MCLWYITMVQIAFSVMSEQERYREFYTEWGYAGSYVDRIDIVHTSETEIRILILTTDSVTLADRITAAV